MQSKGAILISRIQVYAPQRNSGIVLNRDAWLFAVIFLLVTQKKMDLV